jgi:glutaconate CoA-transferase subunit B
MPGHSRSKNGVAELVIGPATSGRTRWLAYVPGIHVCFTKFKTWMGGTGPAMTSTEFRDEELLADVICRLIGDARHIAVGAASPIPATAALLAREQAELYSSPRPYVSLLGSRAHTFFTDGARELFDCAGQGRIDVFFLSGGQIDGEGNINLVSVGDYEKPKARFPGSFGSAYLYYVVPRVILFRVEHSRRTLVPKVDFISAPGGSPDNVARPGGPIALITNRCLFEFNRAQRRFRLASVHPGHSVEEVIENTGFPFERGAQVPVTPAPSAETLRLMRTTVAPMLAEVYPEFARRVFGSHSAAERHNY